MAFASGGTLGHLSPALAIAEALEDAFPGAEPLFFGPEHGLEGPMAARLGRRFSALPAGAIYGVPWPALPRSLGATAQGVWAATLALRAAQVELVVGLGGYASAGPVLAAKALGLPVLLHEANAIPGLANRMLGKLADRVALGTAAAAASFPPGRTTVTGNPVRRTLPAAPLEGRPGPHGAPRPIHVLVLGGSAGAPFLNQSAPGLIAEVVRRGIPIEVWHQSGCDEAASIAERYVAGGAVARVVPFIEDMLAAYAWADLALSRAGAATLAELATAALPALLVPLPSAAGDHQTANARSHADRGAGWWTAEAAWSAGTLADRLAEVLRKAEVWAAASRAAAALQTPHAARAITAEVAGLLPGR